MTCIQAFLRQFLSFISDDMVMTEEALFVIGSLHDTPDLRCLETRSAGAAKGAL